MAIAYFIDGFGAALQDAQNNVLLSVLPTNQHAKMMIGHGIYGFGALSAPLVSTQFAQQKHWAFIYLVSLGIAVMNTSILLLVFRLRPEAGSCTSPSVGDATYLLSPELLKTLNTPSDVTTPATNDTATPVQSEGWKKYGDLMKLPVVHLAAIFIFVYVGVEVIACSPMWLGYYLLLSE